MSATPIERALCCGPTCGRTRPEHGACVAATHGRAQLARLEAAGYVVVPREPTLEMLQDGHDAGRAAYRNGISGMTIDAQIRAQTHKEAAIYRAMIAAAPTGNAT